MGEIILSLTLLALFTIALSIWALLAWAIGPDVRYVNVKQDVTINGDVHVTTTQAPVVPAAQGQRMLPGSGVTRQALPPPPPTNRVIGVAAPPRAQLESKGDRLLPDRQRGEIVSVRVVR